MARILFSRLIFIIFCVVYTAEGFGQESYYIYKKTGEPLFSSDKKAIRGVYFETLDTLRLSDDEKVTLVNQTGEIFALSGPNAYVFQDISKNKVQLNQTSFTRKYFTYVWTQFTNRRKSKQEAGVVYREDRTIIKHFPVDSAKLYQPSIFFRWENNSEADLVYLFLKQRDGHHITKIGTASDSMLLYVDNNLLKKGRQYEWAISLEPFPSLKDIKYNTLTLLDDETFQELKKEMDVLIKTFTLLGYPEAKIKEAICADYKFCPY